MGKLKYIILITTRPKRGKSNINYVSSLGYLVITKGSNMEPVHNEKFKSFDSIEEAQNYVKRIFGSKNNSFCVTIVPQFEKPKGKKNQAAWSQAWKLCLTSYIQVTRVVTMPRWLARKFPVLRTAKTIGSDASRHKAG